MSKNYIIKKILNKVFYDEFLMFKNNFQILI